MSRTVGDVTFCIQREHSQPLSRWWERGCGTRDAVAKADPLILIVFRSSLCVLSLGRGERNKRSDIIENPGDYRHLSHQGPRFSITSENFLSDLLWNLMACCWSGISLANKSIAESKFEACRRTLLQIMGATGPINSFSISFNTVRIRWGSISSSVFFSGFRSCGRRSGTGKKINDVGGCG
jgi:hypothetical protein